MTLAGHLGMTVKECQRKVDAQEFHLWQVFDIREPIGQRRGDFQAAMVAYYTVASQWSSRTSQPPKFSTYLFDFWKKRAYSEEEIEAKAREAAHVIAAGFAQMKAAAAEARRRRGEHVQ